MYSLKKFFIILIALISILFLSCSEGTNNPNYDPPDDHTVKKDGSKHMPGLRDPEINCISCHGDDLRGGETGVSCYECHGKKW